MPDPLTGTLVVGGSALVQGIAGNEAGKRQERAARAGIEEQRDAREFAADQVEPFRQIGIAAAVPLLQSLGIDIPEGLGVSQEQVQQSEIARINPIVDFFREEGFEDIQESAAAQGKLRSGGTLEDLTRFNNRLATTVVPDLQNQRFSQLFNLLTQGQNASVGQGTAALNTASNIGTLLNAEGAASASRIQGIGNAITGGINNAASLAGFLSAGAPPQTPNAGNFNNGTQIDFGTGAVMVSGFPQCERILY